LDTLYLKHETSDMGQKGIGAHFESDLAHVETVLGAVRQHTEHWNADCERWVREEIDQELEGIRSADEMAAALVPLPQVKKVDCADIYALARPALMGLTEDVGRQLLAAIERGAMKIRDDSESDLKNLRAEIQMKGQNGAGLADGRLSRFHLRVMEQCLQYIWNGLLELRAQCNAPAEDSEEALARTMACYVDQVSTRIVQMVREDPAGSGNWAGERSVRATTQRWKAKYSAEARDAMAQVVATQQLAAQSAIDQTQQPLSKGGPFDFGIITALPLEFEAMRAMLDDDDPIEAHEDSNHYEAGFIQGVHRRQHVILTMTPKMGTSSAAATASTLLASFRPTYLLMVGIAGGIPNPNNPEDHVRLGDVVISGESGLIQHDHVKREDGVEHLRDNSARPSATLVQKARVLLAKAYSRVRPWDNHVQRATRAIDRCARPAAETDVLHSETGAPLQHPADPDGVQGASKIYIGRIASGNTLLRDGAYRDELRDSLGVLAIEMEGSGIGDAAWQANGRFLIIRGICDYSDRHKNNVWQGYAAAAAAAVARSLIELF